MSIGLLGSMNKGTLKLTPHLQLPIFVITTKIAEPFLFMSKRLPLQTMQILVRFTLNHTPLVAELRAIYFKDDGGTETNLVLSQDLDPTNPEDGLVYGDGSCNTYGGLNSPPTRAEISSQTSNTFYGNNVANDTVYTSGNLPRDVKLLVVLLKYSIILCLATSLHKMIGELKIISLLVIDRL